MRNYLLITGLFVLTLFFVGCPGPMTAPNTPGANQSTPSSPKAETTELVNSQTGLPLLSPVAGTEPLSPNNGAKFSFAAFGDSQGGTDAGKIVSTIFGQVRDYKPQPKFAFCLGDIVKGKDPQDPAAHIVEKYLEYLALAKTAGIPVFNAPGNHEMDDKGDVPSEKMHQLYRDNVAPTYGAFNYGNSRFIALNTEDVPPAGTPAPTVGEFSYMGDTQLKQLDADLAANKDKTHIFIMMHYPVKPQTGTDALNPESLKKLNAILAKYTNIAYVLASHEHLFYNPQDPPNVTTVAPFKAGDPTRYLISGGAGAGIYAAPDNGGFHHYLIIDVDGDNVSVTIRRIDS